MILISATNFAREAITKSLAIQPCKRVNFRALPQRCGSRDKICTAKRTLQPKCTEDDSAESVTQDKNFFEDVGFNFWIPVAYLLFVSAVVDGGYSGDWSRIGAISKETEEIMKTVSIGFGLLHFGCVGFVFAAGKQRKQLGSFANFSKGLLLGPLYVIEAFFAP
eukprot:TRINITY_DN10803_c0_g1_i4.p3 TRINITY_DN10803_c0_g1~~TRINITY_DN10803_c0_g1_i4.p3  ORF type:complete len:164 (-),score=13.79 TRINITY_DN10803_c0_g1_i4:41-532(-)